MADTPPTGLRPPTGPRREDMAHFRRRSRSIHFWRKALPISIAAIAGLLVLWIGGRSMIVRLTAARSPKDAGVRMVNPRFYGRDSSNRAFVLGAQIATRDVSAARSVTMASPNVTLDADGTNPTHVQANRGVYQEDQRKLSLRGMVELKDGRGYRFLTPEAVVNTTTGYVSGNSGVQGDGPLGHVVASSYGVFDRGQRIVMKGDVHAHIVQ